MNKGVKITSGNVELIYSGRIHCFDDEQTNVAIRLSEKREDELRLIFKFKYSQGCKSDISLKNTQDGIEIELINFNNPLGAGLKKPIVIAELDGRDIFIIFGVFKPNSSNPILDLSLYLENKK